MSIIVAIAHVPIITAPYGLLKLFEPNKRGYAASIPLFVPALGINFSILYGMSFVASGTEKGTSAEDQHFYIDWLNYIIAVMGTFSMLLTLLLLRKLKP